jgi:hypothetical protein
MRVIAGNDPQTTAAAKKSVEQQRPPLRTKPRRCGQQRRRCGLRPATPQLTVTDAKKTSDNNATITDNAPSLRAMRVIAGYDPRRHCGQRPANNSRRKKKRRTTTTHHYGQRPVIAGNNVVVAGSDPQPPN